ncbi:efflux RND transporter permease subunit [Roseibacillus persicicus]|uniref:Cation efflux system protein n=1 Tax=Roseibacillus persicicus TaxID=454148 RepID=A0A918TK60_9BACT|nr:efflux RND transporter permease subunit [Roseibacillus persicicus]GHC51254.1 cation efflux system protein [Roseibacillus persicicus]
MLNHLIRFSLAQRGLILILALVALSLGVRQATQLPVDVLPDLTKPTVTILTESPGFAPEEVETLITVPLENSLMGVSGVTRMRSVNDISLSLIFVEFEWGTDIYKARQFVQERLTGATDYLPDGVTPYMTPVASLMGEIMLVGVIDPSGKTEPRELRNLTDWTIARRLQSITGIAETLSMGGGVKQVQVLPDPERMLALGISFDELREATANAVKNTTGGFLTESSQEIMVRNLAMTSDLSKIAETPVRHENDRVTLISDVAEVQWGIEPMRGDAGLGSHRIDSGEEAPTKGYPGVILSVTKSPGFDTLALTEEVENALVDLRKTLPDGVEVLPVYRQADFIELAVGNLEEALRDGAIMVSIILFLFLLNFRITFITLTAIPLSLGVAILVFQLFGLGVNSMTLGGLAVAIGMVVDDAIVDVENVYRRLRENASREKQLDRLTVIASASAEVRSSILYATILIILVFLPLLGLSGVEGKLFAPIAIATIVSMAASFVVSLTVIPVLSSLLLNPKAGKEHKDTWFVRGMKWLFTQTWLRFSLSQPLLLLLLTLGILGFTAITYPKMGANFLPAFREPTAVVATTMSPGTSLKTTTKMAHTAQDLLLRIPGIETVGFRVGRAERGDHVVPVSTAEFDIEFDKESSREVSEIKKDISAAMAGIPGSFSVVSGPLADRIGHMLSGVSAKVAVKIYGPDLAEIQRLGGEIVTVARSIPGLEEARGEQQAPVPQLRIEVDRKRAAAYGVLPGKLNEQLAALLGGEALAEVYEGERVYDLIIRLPIEWRESPKKLESLYIDTLDGNRVPLSYVAEIRQAKGPNNILRENSQRRYVVSINPTTEDLGGVVETLKKEIAEKVELPVGYRISFEGEYEAQQDATRRIAFMSGLILLIIVFLLFSYFKSFNLVLLVLANIPISIVGGVFLTRYTLDNVSIATLVGFIAISGIAARNSIMMISHYLHLMRHEGEQFGPAMIIRGTEERLVPVLMTALSAGIALLPLVIAAEEPGKEILNPVAIVIVGGLISSTLLGLAITPSFFYAFCRKSANKSVTQNSPASQ